MNEVVTGRSVGAIAKLNKRIDRVEKLLVLAIATNLPNLLEKILLFFS